VRKLVHFDISDLAFVYTTLFALSLVLINPWGNPFGNIWTTPKVYLIIALALLTWGVLFVQGARSLWRSKRQNAGPLRLPARWSVALLLWLAFLASGMVTIFLSPVTFRSALIANDEMGDGWVYWAWMAALVCGNALVLKRFPQLFRAQLYGLLIGGVISAGAVFAQNVNWKLDFTDTSGQSVVFEKRLYTQSWIPRGFMPIGFTSNRGHVGFVLAALTVLVLVCRVRGWLKERVVWPLYAVFLGAVYLTSTRGVMLAFGVGMVYLLLRCWRVPGGRKVMLIAFAPLFLAGALLASGVVGTGLTRTLPPLSDIVKNPFKFTSMRTDLWSSAADGVRARPLFGWGFNGFGLAWPHVNDFDVRWGQRLAKNSKGKPIGVVRILRNNQTSFEYLGEDGNTHRVGGLTNKAHNIILDTAVSVGLVGLALYALLFGFFVFVTARGDGWGLEVLGIVYLVFGLTWFESAQYSHLVWWALSVGLAYALPQGVRARDPNAPTGRVIGAPNTGSAGGVSSR